MSAIVSIPELPRRRDSEESLLLDSRISVADGDTTTTDVEGERDTAGIRTQPCKGRNLSTRTKFFGVELSPDNVVVAMVYFVQGVLGLARLAKIQLKKVSTLLENLWEEAMVLDGNNGGAVWLGGGGERIQETENEEVSWGRNQEDGSQFKPMLEGDWFSNPPHPQDLQMLQSQQDFRFLGGFPFNPNDNLLLHQSIDSSSSCSPSQAFSLDPSQQNQFLSTNNKPCLLNVPSSTNPFDNAFEFGSESGFLGQIHAPISMGFGSLTQLGNRDLSSVPDFLSARSLLAPENNNNNGGFVGGGGGVGFSAPLELEGFGSPANGGFVGSRKREVRRRRHKTASFCLNFFCLNSLKTTSFMTWNPHHTILTAD